MDIVVKEAVYGRCQYDLKRRIIELCGHSRFGRPIEQVIESILEHAMLHDVVYRVAGEEVEKQLDNIMGWSIIGPLQITFGYKVRFTYETSP